MTKLKSQIETVKQLRNEQQQKITVWWYRNPEAKDVWLELRLWQEIPLTGLQDREMGSLAGAGPTEEMHLIQDVTRVKKKEKYWLLPFTLLFSYYFPSVKQLKGS